MSSFSWEEPLEEGEFPVFKKTIPPNAITLKLPPEILHQHDINDLRSSSEKRAPPRTRVTSISSQDGHRTRKPRTKKRFDVVVAEDAILEGTESDPICNRLVHNGGPVKRPQLPSQAHVEGCDNMSGSSGDNLFSYPDCFDPHLFVLPPENVAPDGIGNDIRNIYTDIDMGPRTASLSNIHGTPNPGPSDEASYHCEGENDENNKENLPPFNPIYMSQPHRLAPVIGLDPRASHENRTFTNLEAEGIDFLMSEVNGTRSGRYAEHVAQENPRRAYQFIGRHTLGSHVITSGTNGFGNEFGRANRLSVDQDTPETNTFTPAFQTANIRQDVASGPVHLGDHSESLEVSGSDSSAAFGIQDQSWFGVSGPLSSSSRMSTFIPPRPQSVMPFGPAANQFAPSPAAQGIHVAPHGCKSQVSFTAHTQDWVRFEMPSLPSVTGPLLCPNHYNLGLVFGVLPDTSIVSPSILTWFSQTAMDCVQCGKHNPCMWQVSRDNNLAQWTEPVCGHGGVPMAHSPLPDPLTDLSAIGRNIMTANPLEMEELFVQDDPEFQEHEMAASPSPVGQAVEDIQRNELQRTRTNGEVSEIEAERFRWQGISTGVRGRAHLRTTTQTKRRRLYHGIAEHAKLETKARTRSRGRYIEVAEIGDESATHINSTEKEVRLARLEGFTVNRHGKVLDEAGIVIAYLVSGDIKICAGKAINERGQVADIAGTIVGKVEVAVTSGEELSGGFQLFRAGSDGAYDTDIDSIVVRTVQNIGIRREGLWDHPTKKYKLGLGSGAHWKTIEEWKKIVRDGGNGLDAKAREDLGLDGMKHAELSGRKIMTLLADKMDEIEDKDSDVQVSADDVSENSTDLDGDQVRAGSGGNLHGFDDGGPQKSPWGSPEDMNGLFSRGEYHDTGPYGDDAGMDLD